MVERARALTPGQRLINPLQPSAISPTRPTSAGTAATKARNIIERKLSGVEV